MGAVRKVEASDTRKVLAPTSISVSHRPAQVSGSHHVALSCRLMPKLIATPAWGYRQAPEVLQLWGSPAPVLTRFWELLLPSTHTTRLQVLEKP